MGRVAVLGEPLLLNLGPAHPATHRTVRIVIELDGERIVRSDVQRLASPRAHSATLLLHDVRRRTHDSGPYAADVVPCFGSINMVGGESDH
jgi:NADH:ubiquinone oxidoreductase subunit D